MSACIGFRELKRMLNEMIHILALQLCELAHFVDCIRMDICDLIFKIHSQEEKFYHVVCKIKNFEVSQGIQTFHNFYCILQNAQLNSITRLSCWPLNDDSSQIRDCIFFDSWKHHSCSSC